MSENAIATFCFGTLYIVLMFFVFGHRPDKIVRDVVKDTAWYLKKTGDIEIDNRRAEEARKEAVIQRQLQAYAESQKQVND
jgi:hypothetical protein